MEWLSILLIVTLVYIGIDHGLTLSKLHHYKKTQHYVPQRLIYISVKDSDYMTALYQLSIEVREQNGDEIKNAIQKNGYLQIIFKSGDEIRFYTQDTQIQKLTHHEIGHFINRVFVDYKLPDSAIRAAIDDLGLRNYMIDFGICDESQGGK